MEGQIMAEVSSINGIPNLNSVQIETEYQAKAAKLQKDVVSMQGQMALELIQSVTSNVSSTVLDVKA